MIRRIANILLSVVLLIGFTGFSINMHLCQNRIYDVAIVSEAHSCCEDPGHDHEMTCHYPENNSFNKSKAKSGHSESRDCKDKTVKISSPDNFIISFFDYSPAASSHILFNNTGRSDLSSLLVRDHIKDQTFFKDKSPPDTGRSLSLLQSYLI